MSNGICALCNRGPMELTFHHLIPVTLHKNAWFQKTYTREQMAAGIDICRMCHSGIHDLVEEKILGREYNTKEKLLMNEAILKHVNWVAKRKF